MVSRWLKRLLPTRLWMRWAWERRARRNAMHYVADFRPTWDDDPELFFRTGEDDVRKVLALAGWAPASDARLLEIGCGVGRMTRHFSTRFARVDAVDISPTMIARARELNSAYPNAHFHVGTGVDLRAFPDATFDFVVSYIVFQHIPEERVILGYVDEALRVLKPAGRLFFQARNDPGYHSGPSDTYNGAPITAGHVRATAEKRQRRLVRVQGEGEQECFFSVE